MNQLFDYMLYPRCIQNYTQDVNDFLKEFDKMDETIKDEFWCSGSPIRELLATLMNEKGIIRDNKLYEEMYTYGMRLHTYMHQ